MGTPIRSLEWITCRWRFERSTSSLSTIPSVPTPAAARYKAAGEPNPPAPTALPVLDAGGAAPGDRIRLAGAALVAEARAPFDLASGPVFRARLLRLAADDHVLSLVFHHVVVDAGSLAVFFDELSRLYAARVAGGPMPLEPLLAQYGDYAVRQLGEYR